MEKARQSSTAAATRFITAVSAAEEQRWAADASGKKCSEREQGERGEEEERARVNCGRSAVARRPHFTRSVATATGGRIGFQSMKCGGEGGEGKRERERERESVSAKKHKEKGRARWVRFSWVRFSSSLSSPLRRGPVHHRPRSWPAGCSAMPEVAGARGPTKRAEPEAQFGQEDDDRRQRTTALATMLSFRVQLLVAAAVAVVSAAPPVSYTVEQSERGRRGGRARRLQVAEPQGGSDARRSRRRREGKEGRGMEREANGSFAKSAEREKETERGRERE